MKLSPELVDKALAELTDQERRALMERRHSAEVAEKLGRRITELIAEQYGR